MALELLIQCYDSDDTAEAGTTTTNIKMTGHGLAIGDTIVNTTRRTTSYITSRRVDAVVDVDNVTVVAITGQTTGDTIKKFIHKDRISYLQMESLSIRPGADQRGDCNFTLEVEGTTYVPKRGEDLVIKYDGDVVFGGIIKRALKKPIFGSSPLNFFYDIYSDGYNDIPFRRTVTHTDDNKTSGYLFGWYIDNYLYQEGISRGDIDDGQTVTEHNATCEHIGDIWNSLAGSSGYKWWIDKDKKAHFKQEATIVAAAHDLDGVTFTDFWDFKIEDTADNYHNKIFCRGGLADTGNVAQDDYANDTEIFARQDIEGNSGVYGGVIQDEKIESDADCLVAATNAVKKSGGSRVRFETDALDFLPNTKLKVELSTYGAPESYYLIESVEIYDIGGATLWATVEASYRDSANFSTQRSPGLVEYFQGLVDKGGGGAATLGLLSIIHETNAAAVNLTTSETEVLEIAFVLGQASNIAVRFSCVVETAGGALTLTATTYKGSTAQTYVAQQYCPTASQKYNLSYNLVLESVAAGSVFITVKMLTSANTASIAIGQAFLIADVVTINSSMLTEMPTISASETVPAIPTQNTPTTGADSDTPGSISPSETVPAIPTQNTPTAVIT